jgi:hypothetical protein
MRKNSFSGSAGIAIGYSTFRRNKTGGVYTRPMVKIYRPVYKKGVVKKIDKQILPFGYI